jgi:hypothetical protein
MLALSVSRFSIICSALFTCSSIFFLRFLIELKLLIPDQDATERNALNHNS